MKEIKLANINLDKANAELTAEIECLNWFKKNFN